jgi:hypothetical protein
MSIQLLVGKSVRHNRIFLRECARWSILSPGEKGRRASCRLAQCPSRRSAHTPSIASVTLAASMGVQILGLQREYHLYWVILKFVPFFDKSMVIIFVSSMRLRASRHPASRPLGTATAPQASRRETEEDARCGPQWPRRCARPIAQQWLNTAEEDEG